MKPDQVEHTIESLDMNSYYSISEIVQAVPEIALEQRTIRYWCQRGHLQAHRINGNGKWQIRGQHMIDFYFGQIGKSLQHLHNSSTKGNVDK